MREPFSWMANVPCIAFSVLGVVLVLLGALLPLLKFPAAVGLIPIAIICLIFAWACFVPAVTYD